MLTGMDKMKCGGCGGEDFNIFAPVLREKWLAVECKGCKSTSIITIKAPELVIEWGTGATGIIN